MTVTVQARETRKPEFPATVHAYSDALVFLSNEPDGATAAQIAKATDRVTSNVARDVHKLRDAGVIAATIEGGDHWTLTDKGRRWVAAMAVASGEATVGEGAAQPGDILRVHPSQLRPNPDQPRKVFKPGALEDLAASIAEKGVLLPILVRPAAAVPATDDAYPALAHMIIAGERRWRACMKIIESGEWPEGETILVRIGSDEDEETEFETAVVENMQRDDLNHMEMAHAFERMAKGGKGNAEIARTVNRTPEFVQQHRRLLRLDPELQGYVADGRLPTHEALKLLAGPTKGAPKPEAAGEPEADDATLPMFDGAEAEAGTGKRTDGELQDFVMAVSGRLVTDYGVPLPKDRHVQVWDLGEQNWTVEAAARNIAVMRGLRLLPTAKPSPTPVADPDAPAPLKPRHRLILIELAHKVSTERRPLDPTGGAEWSGDAEADFMAFGASTGSYWLDQGFNDLASQRLVRAAHQPGGQPPLAALTPAGIAWFIAEGLPLPPSDFSVTDAQAAAADTGKFATPERYSTPWLARIAQRAPDSVQPATDLAPAPVNDDPWNREEAAVEADKAMLETVARWVAAPDALDDAGQLFADLGVVRARVNADGGVDLCDEDDAVATIDVDPRQLLPDERVRALELLVAHAINRATGAA